MAAIDFPNAPAVNDIFTSGSKSWQWDGITWNLLSTVVVNSLTGTANQVLVNATTGSAQSGALTLTLPQSIGTGSSPTFTVVNASSGYQHNGTTALVSVYDTLVAGAATTITSTTSADITSATVTIPSLLTGDVVVVTATFDVICTTFTTNTTFVGELSFNTVTQTPIAVFRATVANQRVTCYQQWRLTGSSGSNIVAKLRGRLGVGTVGTMDLAATNTNIFVQVFR